MFVPIHPLSLVDAVKKVAAKDAEVVYEKGIFTGTTFPENMFEGFDFYTYQDGEKVKGVKAEYFANKNLAGEVIYSTFYKDLDLIDGDMWNEPNVPATDFSARFTCYYTPGESGFYSIGGIGDDGYRIFLDDVEIVSMWRDQGPTRAKHDQSLNYGQEYKIVVEYYQSGGGSAIGLGAARNEL